MKVLYKGTIYENEMPEVMAYHVTYMRSIDSIKQNGLTPGNGGGVGAGAYSSWSRGKLFFSTCADDVSFWVSKYKDHAFDRSDDFAANLMIPLVLRFEVSTYQQDSVAASEGRQCSYFTNEKIPPEDLEVFYNGQWTWLDETEFDPNLAIDEEGYLVDDAYSPKL